MTIPSERQPKKQKGSKYTLDFKISFSLQKKAMDELCKRWLTGSSKYGMEGNSPAVTFERKASRRKPHDNEGERNQPIVIAAQFGNRRRILSPYVKKRKKNAPTYLVPVNEHLTYQVQIDGWSILVQLTHFQAY